MPSFKALAAPLVFGGLAMAAPTMEKRWTYNDGQILNYALTLEHLEATFYAQGLNGQGQDWFGGEGYPEWVRYRITEIANQESTHVATLTAGLKAAGVTPVAACEYNFPYSDPRSFVALAQVFEGVGVAAYLGAAPLITNKDYLALAGSILVVESEHNTWLRSAADTQDPAPRPFAEYLGLRQVYTLASSFIKSCPKSNPSLGLSAFPAITVKTQGPYYTGQQIEIQAAGLKGKVYAAFIDAVSTTYQEVNYSSEGCATITIPSYANGQSFFVLTNTNKASGDDATVAGPAMVYVPLYAYDFPYCTPGKDC